MKKTMFRALPVILALALTLAILPLPALAEGDIPFEDVDGDAWYYEYVKYVYYAGLMSGTSDTAFSPDGAMNRAMVVKILHRMDGEPKIEAENPFPDLDPGAYYYDAAIWASSNGILTGSGKGMDPNGAVTREQFATFLYRYAAYRGVDTSGGSIEGFGDSAQVSPYAVDAMSWAVGSGVVTGSDGRLLPGNGSTRSQAAAMLTRFRRDVLGLPEPERPEASALADGQYTVTVRPDKLTDGDGGVYARVDITGVVAFSDEYVNSLKIGDKLNTERFGLEYDIPVEKLERSTYISDELITVCESADYYYLQKAGDEWVLYTYNDMPVRYVAGGAELFFPDTLGIANDLGAMGVGDGANATVYGLRALTELPYFYSGGENLGVEVSDGTVTSATLYYHP